MAFLNKQRFAEKVGRSPRQIIRYVADGILPENAKGQIDLEHPLTKEFLAKMAEGVAPGNPERGSTNPSHASDPNRLSLELSNEANLESLKIQAEINLKTEQALAVKTKRAQLLSVLVPKALVDQKIGTLVEHINANVITLPRRGVSRTLAIIQRYLQSEEISLDTRQLRIDLEQLWKELVSQALVHAKKGEILEEDAGFSQDKSKASSPPPKKKKSISNKSKGKTNAKVQTNKQQNKI